MRAVTFTAAGGPDVIALRDVPTPEPGMEQVRVRVRAAGLNRADLLQRMGRYPAPPGWPADIPGLEYVGTVEKAGPDTFRFRVGDKVMGLVGGGAQAEYVVVHQDELIPVPDGFEWAEAATIPEAFLTAWDALVTRARVQPGERVLIHAVGGGVGLAAVQLARWLGATPVGTSRTASKLQQAEAFGLHEAIDTSREGFRAQLKHPVNVVLDFLGGPAFADNLDALAPRGRLVMLGFLGGPILLADASLEPILRRRLEVIGSVMRTRTIEERVPLFRAFASRVLPAFADGELRPLPVETYTMADAAQAHRVLERNEAFGKVVLEW